MLSNRQPANPERGPQGRKIIQFDLDQVRRFGRIGLTDGEMGAAFGCSARTIERARKQEVSGFEAAYQMGRAETNIALRTRLVERALRGNAYVLWKLAVNRLGYADTAEQVINITQSGSGRSAGEDTVKRKLAGVERIVRRMAQAEARKNRENPQ
jgi:hypothetical protein